MGTRRVEDVSRFILVEATGDSEVHNDDTDPNMVVADEDDAESCSCDTSDYHSCVSDLDGCEEDEAPSCVNVEEEEKDMEVEQAHVYQKRKCGNGFGSNYRSCASVESTDESLNEMEKNRLFWEACLAS